MNTYRSKQSLDVRLTLKNIYRLLSVQDYPLHTQGVMRKNTFHGMTLVRFWHSFFSKALPSDIPLDVFDLSEKRSRALTHILNGTGGPGFRQAWYEQLERALTPSTLAAMAQTWTRILLDGRYQERNLLLKVQTLLESNALSENENMSAASAFFLQQQLTETVHQTESPDAASPVFAQGVLMSWLTWHALLGARMDSAGMRSLCHSNEFRLSALWRVAARFPPPQAPEVLTNRSCALCGHPLSPEQYIGAASLLNTLQQRIERGGKYVLSGMGGIGKTELLRQTIRSMEYRGVIDRIAYVQYNDSLADSLIAAFPALCDTPRHQVLEACRALLEETHDQRTLLLIDNVNILPREDAGLTELAQWDCDIVITSRLASLSGFETISVGRLSSEDSIRLFACHAHIDEWSEEEKNALDQQIQGHPLMLTLLGKLCRSRYWSMTQLNQVLTSEGFHKLSFVENAKTQTMEEICTALYEQTLLEGRPRKLLQLMSILPYSHRKPDALLPLAIDATSEYDVLCNELQSLCDQGWLMQNDQGYAMHPVVAESVRANKINCDELPLLWRYWRSRQRDYKKDADDVYEAFRHVGELNRDAYEVLCQAENNLVSTRFRNQHSYLRTLRENYLTNHPNTFAELEALVHRGKAAYAEDKINEACECLTAMLDFPDAMYRDEKIYNGLCNLLHLLSRQLDPVILDTFLQRLKPRDYLSPQMINYLSFLGSKLRDVDGNVPAALQMLQEADSIIEQLNMHETTDGANCDNLLSFCLADLGRFAEAAYYVGRCLRTLSALQYAEDSVTVMNTRNTYAFMLGSSGQIDAAMQEYEKLRKVYRSQQRTESIGYVQSTVNMAHLTRMNGQTEFGTDLVLEVLPIATELLKTDSVRMSRSLKTIAEVLSRGPNPNLADEPLLLARKETSFHFGENSYQVALCDVVKARRMFQQGEKLAAIACLEQACQIISAALGESRCTEERALLAQMKENVGN